jgi:hypothetical protein
MPMLINPKSKVSLCSNICLLATKTTQQSSPLPTPGSDCFWKLNRYCLAFTMARPLWAESNDMCAIHRFGYHCLRCCNSYCNFLKYSMYPVLPPVPPDASGDCIAKKPEPPSLTIVRGLRKWWQTPFSNWILLYTVHMDSGTWGRSKNIKKVHSQKFSKLKL